MAHDEDGSIARCGEERGRTGGNYGDEEIIIRNYFNGSLPPWSQNISRLPVAGKFPTACCWVQHHRAGIGRVVGFQQWQG